MSTYLITGCSRGLGLALVHILAQRPASQSKLIFATARASQPPNALLDLINATPDRIKYVSLDTTDRQSILQAVSHVQTHLKALSMDGVDVLINNAATQVAELGGARAMDGLLSTLTTNVVAVHEVTAAFLPLLQKGQGKTIINVSSTLGSIAKANDFAMAPVSSYKISKTALNMLTVQYAIDLKGEGFTVVAISPGNMRTEIGGANAGLSTEEGATKTLDIIDKLTPADNGGFKDIFIEADDVYKGGHIPW